MRRFQLPLLSALVAGCLAVASCAFRGEAAAQARKPNRLAGQTSPYLLQHAHNPVDWYPWGSEALEKAKREGKPIFLSVGYSSCHWCHVMERESFEDEGIAQLLNEHFVAIKVDREERPDLDEIYMAAVQISNGSGGWPMSVFLTPGTKPFFGATYFPRDQFAEVLRKVQSSWADPAVRPKIESSADELAKRIGQVTTQAGQAGTVTPSLVSKSVRSLLEDVDAKQGGFGGAPKFPPAMRLEVLLQEYRRQPDARVLRPVTLTLDKMARGGMFDQVGGGFHRYSTDDKWLVPHFEKMLYDNALLARIYLETYAVTGNTYFRRIGEETLDFTLRELRDPDGGFWSTLDADSEAPNGEKHEGYYYLWKPEDVLVVLGKTDGELFNRVYGLTPGGNFEGRSIPNLIARPVSEWALALKMTPEALWARLDAMRTRLRAARDKRPRPALDDKVLANWNGLMLRALSTAFDTTGEVRYRKAAEETAEFLLKRMDTGTGLVHSYRKGKTTAQSFLEDYANVIAGLLDLNRVTGEKRWLDAAKSLSSRMVGDFWDEKSGTFFSTSRGHEALLARSNGAEDGATPSGQSMAALSLVALSRRADDAGARAQAQRVMNAFAVPMKRYPGSMPGMLLAVQSYFTTDTTPDAAGDMVRASLAAPAEIKPGQAADVVLKLEIRAGWHVAAAEGDGLVAGLQVQLAPGPYTLVNAAYPAPIKLATTFSKEPLAVHKGVVLIKLRVKATAGAGPSAPLRVRLRYQACNDRICARPVEVVLTAKAAE